MGGRSLWGSFLDAACERYKWTFDYVMWEISYVNLMMMLSDAVSIDYDTDNNTSKGKKTTSRKNGAQSKKTNHFGDFISSMKHL